MLKKFSCIILVCLLLLSNVFAANASNEVKNDSSNSFWNAEDTVLLHETRAVTQSDLNNHFSNYAESSSVVEMPLPLKNQFSEQTPTTNVVGIVLDYDTELPVANATIAINNNSLVRTGSDGRFEISNVVSNKYNWSISAKGYCTATYRNYDVDVADGVTIFTFYISDTISIDKDRDAILADSRSQTVPPNVSSKSLASRSSMTQVPSVSDTVRVDCGGVVRTVDREVYVYTVLSSELYSTSYYTSKGLTDLEVWQLYYAQSVSINTFLEYALSVYSNHSNADVCASACCQTYDPTKVTEAAIDIAGDIFYTISGSPATVIVFYKPTSTTYSYIWGAYFSSCGNQGTKNHATDSALRAVSCTDLASGAGGHRYGLCQMGAAKLAKDGHDADEILLHYYTNCDTEFCMLT